MAKRKEPVKAKKKNTKKKVLLVIFVIVLLAGIFVTSFLISSPKFSIRKILIKGSEKYSEEEILESMHTKIGDNIFTISKEKNLKALQELSYIGDITFDRNLPNVLQVKIAERKSSFLAYNKETAKYLRLTEDGIIIEELDRAEKTDEELLVFGINFDDNLKMGTNIASLEYEKLELFKKVKEKYEKSEIGKEITSVKFEEDKIALVLEYNLSVILEEKELDYKISFLKDILAEVEGQAGTIDMTKPDPVFTGVIN